MSQVRSCEFLKIFAHDKIRPQLLERMPALDEQRHQAAVEGGQEIIAPTIEEVGTATTSIGPKANIAVSAFAQGILWI